jgi:hypothetical protein
MKRLTLSFFQNFVSLIFGTHRKIRHVKKTPILNSINEITRLWIKISRNSNVNLFIFSLAIKKKSSLIFVKFGGRKIFPKVRKTTIEKNANQVHGASLERHHEYRTKTSQNTFLFRHFFFYQYTTIELI